mmetsp:Transcript_19331/g.37627  ORF Transcript_19331/g.37627 Transcript_19331/m.37627 type:complete len:105 (+) Transcript_19331:255-569(+)
MHRGGGLLSLLVERRHTVFRRDYLVAHIYSACRSRKGLLQDEFTATVSKAIISSRTLHSAHRSDGYAHFRAPGRNSWHFWGLKLHGGRGQAMATQRASQQSIVN